MPKVRHHLKGFLYAWMMQFCDPRKVLDAMLNLKWYFAQLHKYRLLPRAEPLRALDLLPQLHDRIPRTPFDAHYFWSSGWAQRCILSSSPLLHVDIGSHNLFVNMLSARVPVVFMDFRPLNVRLSGLMPVCADILQLPFADRSISSLSCLHVAEHVGLGRYGDPLNPQGTRLACEELKRVLAPGGCLYFAVPVGKPRVCFNAHRIHEPETVVNYFHGLELLAFSGVQDDGRFVERAPLDAFRHSVYACGMFRFQRREI